MSLPTNHDRLTEEEARRLLVEIGTLSAAGQSLESGLAALASDLSTGRLQRFAGQLRSELQAGASLAAALGRHQDLLPVGFQGLIAAGIQSGALDVILIEMAEIEDRQTQLRWSLFTRLGYPVFFALTVLGMAVFIATMVVQPFKRIFADFGIELPNLTLLVIGYSNFITDYTAPIVGLTLLAALAAGLRQRLTGRPLIYSFPMLGPIWRWGALSHFYHLLGLLLGQQLPAPTALRLAGDCSRDRHLARSTDELSHQLERGLDFTDVLPDHALPLVRWGNEQHAIPEAFTLLGRIMEERSRNHADYVNLVIVPIFCFLMIGSIGVMLVALFLPLFKLLGALSS